METGEALTGLVAFSVLMGFSALAFRIQNPVLFLMLSAISLFFGFYAPDFLSGGTTSNFSLSVGVMMIVYCFFNVGLAYWFLFNNKVKGNHGSDE